MVDDRFLRNFWNLVIFSTTIEFFIKDCRKVNKKKQLNEEKCEKEFLLLIIMYSK